MAIRESILYIAITILTQKFLKKEKSTSDHRKSIRWKCRMVKCLLLRQQSVSYRARIADGKNHSRVQDRKSCANA